MSAAVPPLLEVRDLSVVYGDGPAAVRAVDGVSFSLAAGEALALVGESGSGKSSIGLALLGLSRGRVTGSVRVRGVEVGSLGPAERQGLRGRVVGMVFQDTGAVLNPVRTVGAQLRETLDFFSAPEAGVAGRVAAGASADRAVAALAEVGLDDPAARLSAYPHQLSGGQRQRVVIALALAAKPALLIADEPTSALDTVLQNQLCTVFSRLRRDRGLGLLFITHQLRLLPQVAEQVAVLQAGRIVETGTVQALVRAPTHPHSRALAAAVPSLQTRGRPLMPAKGADAER